MDETTPKYFTEFKKELFGHLKYKFDGISEQVAKLSEKVTVLEIDMKEVKETVHRTNKRLDQHSDLVSIFIKQWDKHETRLTKLEKEVF